MKEHRDLEELISLLRQRGILFADGLTDDEVARVETTFGFRFPPDLRAFLQYALPVSGAFPNWRDEPEASLWERFEWPVGNSVAFDIEYADFWLEEWGPKPEDLAKAIEIANKEIAKAPKLIPIYGSQRRIPEEPHLAGNPIFSARQLSDTIYYGTDLANYFENEFLREGGRLYFPNFANVRKIRFWDRLTQF